MLSHTAAELKLHSMYGLLQTDVGLYVIFEFGGGRKSVGLIWADD